MKRTITFIAFLCMAFVTKSQTIDSRLLEPDNTQDISDQSTNDSAASVQTHRNKGDLNIGFTYWSYAETGKGFTSPQSPWQVFNVLSADIGYETDNLYGYFLYTFNDNSLSCWLGYKFRIGGETVNGVKPKKKWDTYAVFTRYPNGEAPYIGLGLEYSWDIAGPLSLSYFIEPGMKNDIYSFSTGFMMNLQQGVLKKARK